MGYCWVALRDWNGPCVVLRFVDRLMISFRLCDRRPWYEEMGLHYSLLCYVVWTRNRNQFAASAYVVAYFNSQPLVD